jgi:hypothetical protein
VICTWTGPHRVCATGPVTVLAALADPVVLLDEDADVPPDPVPPAASPFDGAVAAPVPVVVVSPPLIGAMAELSAALAGRDEVEV